MADEEERRLSPGVRNLLRDVAIAFLIVAVLLAALFAYARVWPPMVVVESASMQHSDTESFLGVIDTGDIVLVQSAPQQVDVTTYVEGRARAHQTYGDAGDVIIFRRYGREDTTPIIHRAIMFLEWNETADGFDIPSLLELERGVDWESNREFPFGLGEGDYVLLKHVNFRDLDLRFTFGFFVSFAKSPLCPTPCSGFVTMGDNNAQGQGGYDDWIVKEEWVLGRARGEVPWFGLLKLVVGGPFGWGDSRAPANSWTSLTVALIVLIGAPLVIDVVLSLLAPKRSGNGENPGREDKAAEEESEEFPR